MAGDTDKTVFGERTRRPSVLTIFNEPLMGELVMDMHWIGQSKKQIDVEKINRHGVSSRSWLTNSWVTIPASGWTGKIGRPSLWMTLNTSLMAEYLRCHKSLTLIAVLQTEAW